jgi:hypothetical protein
MSGGPYGRGKAPERACLPIANWPEADRQSWLEARRPADLLEEHIGARASHSEASNRKAQKGYGRWLTFLTTADPDCIAEPPAGRITKERVGMYVESLIALDNSTATILARLQELGEVAKVLAPERSWTFITRFRPRFAPVTGRSETRATSSFPMNSWISVSGSSIAANWQAACPPQFFIATA